MPEEVHPWENHESKKTDLQNLSQSVTFQTDFRTPNRLLKWINDEYRRKNTGNMKLTDDIEGQIVEPWKSSRGQHSFFHIEHSSMMERITTHMACN